MAANPVPSGDPSSKVELSISCTGLKDKDVFSKSDPIAVLYVKQSQRASFTEVIGWRYVLSVGCPVMRYLCVGFFSLWVTGPARVYTM